MGLGKTIEMLSLMHSHRGYTAKTRPEGIRLHVGSSSIEWAPATTLVVAPMSLLAQWKSEAEKASHGDSLRVLVYYGADKSVNLRSLCCERNAAYAPNLI